MLMRLINGNILEYNEILILGLRSRGARFLGFSDEKKGRRSAPSSLSVNLVSLVYLEKYASKEEKCASADEDFKTSHYNTSGMILIYPSDISYDNGVSTPFSVSPKSSLRREL